MTSWFAAVNHIITAAANEARPSYLDRRGAFDAWEAYYHNQIYDRLSEGGQREQVNASLGNVAAADLAGLYNPVAEVVDLYQHVLGGQFRQSTDPENEDAPTDIRAQARNTQLLQPLDAIWGWSNLNLAKQQICRLAPLHGTVGLRVVAVDSDDPLLRRVYLKPEHPRIIRDVEQDARGNVTAIELEYDVTRGLGDAQETVTVRELLTKQRLQTFRVVAGGALVPYDTALHEDRGPGADLENALGVVPYVLLVHQDTGDAFGLNAFYRARGAIDRLNALLTHLDTQILDHVKVDWLVAASGPPPAVMTLNGRNVIYVDTSRGQTPPVMEPMVAPLNLADAIVKARFNLELIEDRLPELKAIVGRFLSGQSGETVAQLRAPAEQRLGLARATYEDALMRATQIAVSWGILLDMWNVGTGTGSKEAADRAYQTGMEDFRFNRRPLLPPTEQKAAPQPAPVVAVERVPPVAVSVEEGGVDAPQR